MIPCYKSIKLLTDKVFALALLFLLSPLMLFIALVVYMEQHRIFFIQTRPGYLGTPFRMYKFSTMDNDRDKPDIERITLLGFWLRKLSLDELPQLWNILKGEMSFIGPRPFLMEYLPLYSKHHMQRHHVMPGITGLAQVTGKNNVGWTEKLDMDVYYTHHINFFLDVKIVLLTINYFIRGCPGSYPATKFAGYYSDRH